MALDVGDYLTQLAQTAGLADEDKAGLLKAAGNEKFAKALEGDVLRQSEFSRNMDKLKADEKKSADYYAQLLQWNADKKAEYDALMAAGSTHRDAAAASGFTAEEAKKLLAEENIKRDVNMLGLFKTGLKLAGQHLAEFKEPLDVDGVVKLATEKNLSFDQAYNELIAPRRSTISAESLKAQLAAAREEGAKDALSKHHIPTDAKPKDYHPIFDRDPKKQVGADDYVPNSGRLSPGSERSLKENFADAWNNAASASSSTT